MGEPLAGIIEKVARAIYAAENSGVHVTWTDEDIRGTVYFTQARAAIAAMREPTEEMMISGRDYDYFGDPDRARLVWQAMIDKALEEAS